MDFWLVITCKSDTLIIISPPSCSDSLKRKEKMCWDGLYFALFKKNVEMTCCKPDREFVLSFLPMCKIPVYSKNLKYNCWLCEVVLDQCPAKTSSGTAFSLYCTPSIISSQRGRGQPLSTSEHAQNTELGPLHNTHLTSSAVQLDILTTMWLLFLKAQKHF